MNDKKKSDLKENFKQIVDNAAKIAEEVGSEISKTAEKLVEEAKSMKRQVVISVRFDDESAECVGLLVEAGICKTRSEAVAYLVSAGIRERKDLFRRIRERIDEIRNIKEELKRKAKEDIK